MRSFGHQGRVDVNQDAIVTALRKAGCSVLLLSRLGGGAPDALVARVGKMWIMEIKTDGGTLAQSQLDWIKGWNSQVHTVRSIEGALAVVGLVRSWQEH